MNFDTVGEYRQAILLDDVVCGWKFREKDVKVARYKTIIMVRKDTICKVNNMPMTVKCRE